MGRAMEKVPVETGETFSLRGGWLETGEVDTVLEHFATGRDLVTLVEIVATPCVAEAQ